MNRFASGPQRHYYGKGDVIVYRLNRTGKTPAGTSPVFGASVLMLLYGDAFWQTYTTGDNSKLIATDSMKNFIQRETMNFGGHDLEGFCRFLAEKFLRTYPQVEGSRGPDRSDIGIERIQAASTRRQRVQGVCARPIYDAARSEQQAAAHVARSRLDLHDGGSGVY